MRKLFMTVVAVGLLLGAAVIRPEGGRVSAAGPIPAGLPSHFGLGVAAAPSANGLTGWMPTSGIPWDYAYQYLSGGTNTGSGWETWNSSGQFPLYYAQSANSHHYLPVFSYYELLQSTGSCASCGEAQKDLANLNTASLMASYFSNFRLLMQRLGSGTYGGITGYGKTAIVQVEPDLSGYAQQAVLNTGSCYGYCTAQGNTPANLTAAVASSGDADVQRFPNTYQGFNWALLHLRDLYAPNVLLAFHVSNWATGTDIGTSTDPTLPVSSLGQEAGAFAAASGTSAVPSGVTPYDLVFNDVSDRDAGYYTYVAHKPNVWWDRLNVTFPNFHRWEGYVSAASQAAGKSVIVWQVPLGNQYFATENNTNGHYQDNRVEYFLSHIAELAQSGIIGVLFGAGNGGSTVNYDGMNDGITNPSPICSSDGLSSGQICATHTSTVSDDDGGYLRMTAQQYYATPYSLSSSSSTPPPTATPTNTPALTPTNTPGAVSGTSTPIYTDSLSSGWYDGSWSATDTLANTSPVHAGADSIAFSTTAAWGGLYLTTSQSSADVNTATYPDLHFWAQATHPGQDYMVKLADASGTLPSSGPLLSSFGGAPPVGSWKEYSIPVTSLGMTAGSTVTGVVLQDNGTPQPTLYVDDVSFYNPSSAATSTPTNTPVPPTNTPIPPTNTPVPPTNTPTPTKTPTSTPTTTPTSTPTAQPVATSTLVPPTSTPASLHVTINRASASPTSVARGSTTALSTTITTTTALSGAIVDFEIYNSAGSRIYQTTRSPTSFAANTAKTITASWTVPTTQATGTYTLKIGVFGSGWTPLYAWNNGGATITVS